MQGYIKRNLNKFGLTSKKLGSFLWSKQQSTFSPGFINHGSNEKPV